MVNCAFVLIVTLVGIHTSVGQLSPVNHATVLMQMEGRGASNGIIHLMQVGSTLTLTGVLEGLPPGKHGLHVHQYGDVSNKCLSMGPHFSEFPMDHGAPHDSVRHDGDLGNVLVGPDGRVNINITDARLGQVGLQKICGRGVIIHQSVDDLGRGNNAESKKTGNAGGRLSCGPIAQAAPAMASRRRSNQILRPQTFY